MLRGCRGSNMIFVSSGHPRDMGCYKRPLQYIVSLENCPSYFQSLIDVSLLVRPDLEMFLLVSWDRSLPSLHAFLRVITLIPAPQANLHRLYLPEPNVVSRSASGPTHRRAQIYFVLDTFVSLHLTTRRPNLRHQSQH
jgi:hypothetical protein